MPAAMMTTEMLSFKTFKAFGLFVQASKIQSFWVVGLKRSHAKGEK